MKPTLFTALAPSQLHLYDLQDASIVIIDVFRATSTIAAALYNGARYIVPVDDVTKAIDIAKKIDGIAAGERDGKLAEGMQYGNSPMEYTPDFIKDKILVLTTTNGTKLLHMATGNGATDIVAGSFPNLSAITKYLVSRHKNVVLACAGWKEKFNLEDCLFAGAVIDRVQEHFTIHCDSSLMSVSMYRQHRNDLLSFSRNLTHYHRLVERFGYIKDIEFCLSADVANVLPLYKEGRLVAAKNP